MCVFVCMFVYDVVLALGKPDNQVSYAPCALVRLPVLS